MARGSKAQGTFDPTNNAYYEDVLATSYMGEELDNKTKQLNATGDYMQDLLSKAQSTKTTQLLALDERKTIGNDLYITAGGKQSGTGSVLILSFMLGYGGMVTNEKKRALYFYKIGKLLDSKDIRGKVAKVNMQDLLSGNRGLRIKDSTMKYKLSNSLPSTPYVRTGDLALNLGDKSHYSLKKNNTHKGIAMDLYAILPVTEIYKLSKYHREYIVKALVPNDFISELGIIFKNIEAEAREWVKRQI